MKLKSPHFLPPPFWQSPFRWCPLQAPKNNTGQWRDLWLALVGYARLK
jgi:hypothetical protein